VAYDPGQADRIPPQSAMPNGTQDLEPSDAGPGTPVDKPTTRHLRGWRNFRGHIEVDDDEPLAVFGAPAEPPPVPPAAPDGQASQGYQ
jgi:hypothetical protein